MKVEFLQKIGWVLSFFEFFSGWVLKKCWKNKPGIKVTTNEKLQSIIVVDLSGPCRGRFATDVPCTIEDIRSSAMGQNSDYVKIIESTYKFENTDIMTSSSSWPWNEAHLKEDDGATTCHCLDHDELDAMLGVDSDTLEYIYSQMCVQPVPWCFVSAQESDCADQTSSRIRLKNSEIAWSQIACSTFKLPSFWSKKPGHF